MTDDELIHEIACIISSARIPSSRSLDKARTVLQVVRANDTRETR